MTIGHFYLGLLGLGLAYALLAGLTGWLSDLGGGDIHFDTSGHLDAGHLHPISGTTVATFITGFGGGGTVAHYFLNWSLLGGLALGVATGAIVAGAAYALLEVVFRHTEAGSEYTVEEVIGREAEVITAIPEGGVGEIAYIARGQRVSCSAKSVDGATIPKGSLVLVDKITGSTAYVRRTGS